MSTNRPDLIPDPQPENARQAVAMVRDDHNWVEAKPDLNSTDGIKKNITALWAAIDRLAAYVDGDKSQNASNVKPAPYQAPKPKTEFKPESQTPASV